MGYGGAITLGGGRSRTKTSERSELNQTSTQAQTQTGSTFGVTTTLDPQTIATLQSVIQTIAPNVGQSADADLIRTLSSQLATSLDPALVQANIKAAQDVAIRNFSMNQGAQIAGLQQQVGSKGNAFSQIIQNAGNADLSALLAQISTQGQLGFAAQQSANLGAAIQGIGSASQVARTPLQDLLASISTLTGARTEASVNTQQQANAINNLNAIQTSKGEEFMRYFNHQGQGSYNASPSGGGF